MFASKKFSENVLEIPHNLPIMQRERLMYAYINSTSIELSLKKLISDIAEKLKKKVRNHKNLIY